MTKKENAGSESGFQRGVIRRFSATREAKYLASRIIDSTLGQGMDWTEHYGEERWNQIAKKLSEFAEKLHKENA